jgi:hypothetical protein
MFTYTGFTVHFIETHFNQAAKLMDIRNSVTVYKYLPPIGILCLIEAYVLFYCPPFLFSNNLVYIWT